MDEQKVIFDNLEDALRELVRIDGYWDLADKLESWETAEEHADYHLLGMALERIRKHIANAEPLPPEADARDAEIARLKAENEAYRQAFGEIQSTMVLSSSMQGWTICTDVADKALKGEYIYPDTHQLGQMKWERDQAREALKSFSDVWGEYLVWRTQNFWIPKSFSEWMGEENGGVDEIPYTQAYAVTDYNVTDWKSPDDALQADTGDVP